MKFESGIVMPCCSVSRFSTAAWLPTSPFSSTAQGAYRQILIDCRPLYAACAEATSSSLRLLLTVLKCFNPSCWR